MSLKNTLLSSQLKSEANKEARGIALFLLTTIILGSLASFVTNLPTPTRKAEIASGVRAFK